jgi:hypothetical protein
MPENEELKEEPFKEKKKIIVDFIFKNVKTPIEVRKFIFWKLSHSNLRQFDRFLI